MKIEHIQKKDKAALPNVNEKTEFSRKKSNNKIKKKTQKRKIAKTRRNVF
jgi:copper chaperone CopZ